MKEKIKQTVIVTVTNKKKEDKKNGSK